MGGKDEVFYCSFCGRSNEKAGRMLVKSDRQVLNRQVKFAWNAPNWRLR